MTRARLEARDPVNLVAEKLDPQRVLAEGDAQARKDIVYLNKLPVFNADGTVKE